MPVDFVDYTLLQKKGLLKVKEPEARGNIKIDKEGFVDFSQVQPQSTNSTYPAPTQPSAPAPPSGEMFGFMDMSAMASGSGAANPVSQNSSSSPNPLGSSTDSDVATLKVKIDDIEYKLARLMDKLSAIESRLG